MIIKAFLDRLPGNHLGKGVHACAILLLVLLTACGGGGSGGGGETEPETETVDTDGDGFSDKAEKDAGTDPTNFYSNTTERAKLRFTVPLDLTNSEGHAYAPSLALGKDGNPHIAWHDNVVAEDVEFCDRHDSENQEECAAVGGSAIFYSRSSDYGLSYSASTNISNTVGIAEFAEIAVDSNDNVYVVWKDTSDGYSNIYFNSSNNGGISFGSAKRISTEAVVASNPDVAVDTNGNVIVSWYETEAVKIAKSTDKGTSFNVIASFVALDLPLQTDVTVDVDNAIHVVYEDIPEDSDILQTHYVKSDATQTVFSAPKVLSLSERGVTIPRVATDSQGNVFVSWTQFFAPDSGKREEIYLTRSFDGGNTFESPRNFSDDAAVSVYSDIFIAPDDRVYIVWQDTAKGNYETVVSYSADKGETFIERMYIAPSDDGSLISTIMVNQKNQIFVTWDDNRYGTFDAVISKGDTDQPAIAKTTLSSEVISPNNDNLADTITLNAWFTESLRWTVEVYKLDESDKVKGRIDRLAKVITASDANYANTATATWDGIKYDGSAGEEGKYYFLISGETREGIPAITSKLNFSLSKTLSSDLPDIEVFESDSDVFAPDGDGRRESVKIDASFNKSLSWNIIITDALTRTVTTKSGSGDVVEMTWDGRYDNSSLSPEDGVYTVTLNVSDDKGNSLTDTLSITIDRVAPILVGPDFSPVDPDGGGYIDGHDTTPEIEDDTLKISLQMNESAVVTAYIYDAAGVSLIKVLSRKSYYTDTEGNPIQIDLEWDGTTGGDNGSAIVAPGIYSIKIWARDFAANRFDPYPIITNFQVR